MTGRAGLSLRDGLDLCGEDVHNLWMRYIGLGGSKSLSAFAAQIDTGAQVQPREHDMIAQALNESFLDQGIDVFPVATVLLPTFPTTRMLSAALRARCEVARQRSRYLQAQSSRVQAAAAAALAWGGNVERARQVRERAERARHRAERV